MNIMMVRTGKIPPSIMRISSCLSDKSRGVLD